MRARVADLAAIAAVVAAFAILVALGTWQLQRRGEKEALIAAVSARAFGPATALPGAAEWGGLDLSDWDFRKVAVEGTFRASREFHVYTILPETRTRAAQPGWWVYAPFDLAGGGTVLVNRGFVPVALKEPAARPASVPQPGPTRLEGLVRPPDMRGLFTNADDPARNTFYTRDAAAFAAAGGLGTVAPFTIEQMTPNPAEWPLAGQVRVSFPNRHLEYALTWYGLAATLVVVVGLFVVRRRRQVPHASIPPDGDIR